MAYRWVWMGCCVVLGGLVAPSVALADPAAHPRTPVLWEGQPCLTIVDQSVDPILEIHYEIPYEDTDVPEREVADSRRHQFFAFCRQTHAQDFLPAWITDADFDAALAAGLVDEQHRANARILEGDAQWEGCWQRLVEDDARRPITYEAADVPVVWDTSSVTPGAYTISGYTWEPAFNLWKARYGTVVKVVDGEAPDPGPAAAVTTRRQLPYLGESVAIEGCVSAASGSKLTASWATTEGAGQEEWSPSWIPFAEEIAVDSESFAIQFTPPEEAAGQSVMVRVDVVDGAGQAYAAHMGELVIVLLEDPDDCSFVCDDDDHDAEPDGRPDTSEDADDGKPDSAGDAEGCGCRSDRRPPTWLFLLVPIIGRRRRRA